MTLTRPLAALALATSLALNSACGGVRSGGDDGDLSFKFSSYVSEDSIESQVARLFFERVDELSSNTSISTEYFYGGALLAPEDTLTGIAEGRSETGVYTVLYNPAELPLSQIVTVPFMSNSGEAVARTATDLYENNPDFRAEFDRQGVVPLLWAVVPNSTLGFTEEVTSINDISGKRVRAVGFVAEALEALGAEAVALPATDVYEALQQKVIDGFGSLTLNNSVNSFRVHEVAPNFVNAGTGQYVLSAQVMMDVDVYESLPDEVKDAIKEAAVDVLAENVEMQDAESERACQEFLEEGGTVTALPQAEIDAWSATARDDALASWAQAAQASGLSAKAVQTFQEEWIAGLEEHAAEASSDTPSACSGGA